MFFIIPMISEIRGHVLDVGCGAGIHLEGYSGRSLGIDASEENINICHRKKLNVIKRETCHLPVKSNGFDTVFLSHILEHLEEPERALNEAYRIIKNSGRIIVVAPCWQGFIAYLDKEHKHFITEDFLDQVLLDRLGCEKVKSYTFPSFTPPVLAKYRELRAIYQKKDIGG